MNPSAPPAHDYVIVGAGSAGCVLANRLSARPGVRVLLLEAGPADRRREIAIPAAFPTLMRSDVDWNDTTAPQSALGGREIYHPRGKVIGGCSSVNAQIYQRGDPADFDEWADAGADGWRWTDVLPWFIRAEHNERGATDLRGSGGPINVADLRDPNPLSRAFVEAAVECGIAPNDDFSGPRLAGVGFVQVTQKNGRRWSAADAYLHPVRSRPNLAVLTGAQVTRVVIDGRRATGVEYVREGRLHAVRAEAEVIVAGGAFNSPHLLMLSGIGDGAHLRRFGVQPRHHLPGVGRNLQDHPLVGVKYACSKPVSLLAANAPGCRLRYVLFRRGMLTSNIAEALAFVRTSEGLRAPDLEVVFGPVLYDVMRPPTVHAFSIGAVALKPRSAGFVALRSADPLDRPIVQPAYLSDPGGDDLRVLSYGVRLAQRIAGARALGAYRGQPLVPPVPLRTDEEIARFVREQLETIYHPAGTCRMGRDPLAVVDSRLRVHGLEGLRVVDASVMPSLVRGHPNAAIMMLAEKAAADIRS